MADKSSKVTPAQSEVGPTTYAEGGEIIQHGADDPETQHAYRNGDPKDGVANARAASPDRARNVAGQPVARTADTAAAPATTARAAAGTRKAGTKRVVGTKKR